MRKQDRNNLDFIINSTEEEFDQWMEQASDDDIQYALELIAIGKTETIIQEYELFDGVEDLSIAKIVLNRFKKE
jgi:hypothetical protein